MDSLVETFNVSKATLLRSFTQKTGVQVFLHLGLFGFVIILNFYLQILLREYQFDNKSVQSFTEDDVVNMWPIVKHINPRYISNLP